ncbi:oxidoreductase, zinc-binding dehydrogenase family superfamily [Trichophyton verrucosum HKI 0517]|uniref:Oxidoreductase, zinc-binding dehydrogenase family superfamily n=1 Tax=Trichophyton verrucosum (strain HKI 0517) TaxID=663202 RepID=D4D9D3_TRIVH|nr:oxidoreductase, zinc-binding dehydrogenase family superfamily [Trichophyton verrucosum HKI 0517]EFE41546.1 oxidoreductase, zinc-binding dehydrogenase family superfamily [Trichophyton verrucosum HKI 0517]
MTQLPDKQTALTFGSDGNLRVSHEAQVATLKPDMIIVKTAVVSVNPVDTKMEAGFSKPGLIGGCDFAGVVVAVGSGVKRNVKVGDRVSGAVMGSDPLDPSSGAFATYVSAPADITLTLPENVPWSVGGAMSTIWFTAGQALFQNLLAELDVWPILRPAKEPKTVLVYGGSTSVGTTAIQLLKLAGLRPIATCSPKNYELVKSYGAEEVFDYRSPTCAEDIKKATRNNLKYALDCISTKGSIDICYGAIGRAGGHYTSLDPFWESTANTRKAIKATWIVGISMLGKDIAWPPPYERPGSEETRAFGGKLAQILQKILDEKKMKPHPLRIKEQATWYDVLEGLDEVKSGRVSGEKLVFVF